jgi:hypothetical protein
MAASILTQDYIKSLLHYNPETGLFTRLKNGAPAGSNHKSGYVRIKITSKHSYLAHRMAWIYMTGEMPKIIDHINGNGLDNRFCNLRNVTNAENLQNIRHATKRNQANLLGAHKVKGKDIYSSSIWVQGKKQFIGYFATAQEAHNRYVEVKREVHNTCTI